MRFALVGGFKHGWIIFHFINICGIDVILPTDEVISFKMVQTTNQCRFETSKATAARIRTRMCRWVAGLGFRLRAK